MEGNNRTTVQFEEQEVRLREIMQRNVRLHQKLNMSVGDSDPLAKTNRVWQGYVMAEGLREKKGQHTKDIY